MVLLGKSWSVFAAEGFIYTTVVKVMECIYDGCRGGYVLVCVAANQTYCVLIA